MLSDNCSRLVSLIGEQPTPILILDRWLKPIEHILVCTERTLRIAQNLQSRITNPRIEVITDAYELESLCKTFSTFNKNGMIFNLTGGTKPMSWAVYEIARSLGHEIVYLESENKRSILYRIKINNEGFTTTKEIVNEVINIDDYLTIHGLKIIRENQKFCSNQEMILYNFLREQVDEIKYNVIFGSFEIDFIVRRKNQIAIIEAKSGKSRNRVRYGLDQLTTIGGREFLGIYTGKIWCVNRPIGKQILDIARAYNIKVVRVDLVRTLSGDSLSGVTCKNILNALDVLLGQD